MQKLVKLVRLSSKEAFIKLRDLWYIYCKDLDKSFKVTNLFLNHISWSSKNREINDIIERLSSINLIEKISCFWRLVEIRKDIIIENRRFFQQTFKIKYRINKFDFSIILWEKNGWEIILISIFLNYLE